MYSLVQMFVNEISQELCVVVMQQVGRNPTMKALSKFWKSDTGKKHL